MKRVVVWIGVLSMIAGGAVSATSFNSTNLRIDGSIGDSIAGRQTSTNYEMIATGGESIAGQSASTSYRLGLGYTAQFEKSIEVSTEPNGLVAHYALENAAPGAVAFDESTNRVNGTFSAGAGTGTGKVGNAFSDTSAAQNVSIPHNAVQLTGNKMTISAWVKYTQASEDAVLTKWQYSTTDGSWALQRTPSGTNFRMYVRASGTDGGSNYVDSTNASLANNTWYYLTMVYDGTQANASRVKLYLNGSPLSTTATGTIPTTITSSTNDMSIGSFPGQSRFIRGSIDEVKLFNRTLSDGEITAEYTAQNNGKPTGIFAGAITPGTSQTSLVDSVVLTDAPGYTLAINQSSNLTMGSYTIPASPGNIASPLAWTEGTTKGLGFTLYGASGTAPAGTWNSGANYAALPGAATSFYTRSGYGGGTKDSINMRLRLDTNTNQAAGAYTNQVTITGTMIP